MFVELFIGVLELTLTVHRQWYGTTSYGSPQKMTFEEYIVSTLNAGDLAMVFHGSYESSNDNTSIQQERKNNENQKMHTVFGVYLISMLFLVLTGCGNNFPNKFAPDKFLTSSKAGK